MTAVLVNIVILCTNHLDQSSGYDS